MINPFMQAAVAQAKLAAENGEVPVGAVIVQGGNIIAQAYNQREQRQKATSHAEIEAIEQACAAVGSWRLSDCSLYVTLEPCMMCMGAILQARIHSVYFGAYAKSENTLGAVFDCMEHTKQFPVTVYGGIMEQQCEQLLQQFFQQERKHQPC